MITRGPNQDFPFEELANLPRILGLEVSKVRFDPPKRFMVKGRMLEKREAIELKVQTSWSLPILDLSPVLFIGDLIVDEYHTIGKNLYSFIAYDIDRLTPGLPISLGWPFAADKRMPSNFNFNFGKLPRLA